MNINDVIHGFKVKQIRHEDEIKADVYEMLHEKTGARLLWLKRADENKTFSIAFKTTPVDDTGVFHILEHSVLNGSEKYPVREPFVDLLKGSLQTFLNAMTYPDKTVYPVSSRNNKDFINLMRVYLDAVFHPIVLKNPNIFYQEGWHYELNDINEEPIYKGVVFNEMKGAFSSPDSIISRVLMHSLFPDTCYGNESGGDPDYITSLSYEQFCEAHRKYYSPSNSYIVLDGDMDIDNVLAIINDEYLCNYEKIDVDVEIRKQQKHISETVEREYEISPETDPSGKSQLSYAYVIGNFDDYEKTMAFSLISSVLCDSNESPLKKAILSKHLGEDVAFGVQDGILQPYVQIDITNTDAEKKDEIDKTIREVFEETIRNGFEKEELEATLNLREFKARERDFGGMPKGLVYALSSLDSWLYGGDPLKSICFNKIFESLREKINSSYYEDLLKEVILNSTHCGSVLLRPSNTLGEQKAEKERKKLHDIAATWNKEDKEKLLRLNSDLKKWQASEDTPEQKATLPALHLEDLKKTPTDCPVNVYKHNDNTIVEHNEETNDIAYVTLMSAIDDVKEDDLMALSQMLSFLSRLATKNYDLIVLSRKMRSILGDFSSSFSPYKTYKESTHKNLVSVSFSSLERNINEACELVKEIIYKTDFSDRQMIRDLLKQNIFVLEQAFLNSGHSLAVQRSSAYSSSYSAAMERSAGYEAYKKLKDLDDNWETKADDFINDLNRIRDMIFIKERYTLSVDSHNKDVIIDSLIDKAPSGTIQKDAEKKALGHRREGISVPANVSFAVKSSVLEKEIKNMGIMYVISNILTYDYLWNNIRVKGGAYGTGFRSGFNKGAILYSYRDPDPANSLRVYRETVDYLKDFVEKEGSIENYIVGTTGDYDPLLSTRTSIRRADLDYLMGISYQDRQEILDQILNADKEEIRKCIPLFEKINEDDNVCVIGNAKALEKCKDQLDTIFDLNSKA